jgi:hypothetical protein
MRISSVCMWGLVAFTKYCRHAMLYAYICIRMCTNSACLCETYKFLYVCTHMPASVRSYMYANARINHIYVCMYTLTHVCICVCRFYWLSRDIAVAPHWLDLVLKSKVQDNCLKCYSKSLLVHVCVHALKLALHMLDLVLKPELRGHIFGMPFLPVYVCMFKHMLDLELNHASEVRCFGLPSLHTYVCMFVK